MANILWIDDKAGSGTEKRLGFDGLIFFIEKNGHQIDIRAAGDEIEQALSRLVDYKLIILDIIMDSLPSADDNNHQFGGFDALEILIKHNSKLPIIILSVMSKEMIYEEANRRRLDLTRAGVKIILRKGPILPSELANIVEDLLSGNKKVGVDGDQT